MKKILSLLIMPIILHRLYRDSWRRRAHALPAGGDVEEAVGNEKPVCCQSLCGQPVRCKSVRHEKPVCGEEPLR